MRSAFVVSLLICLLREPASAAQDGLVRGTVVDETGVPVSSAKVNADPVNRGPIRSLVRYVETDAQGTFSIDRLAWGKYRIFAMKEETGYPNMRASFYSNDVFPVVAVTPEAPIAQLRIQLGPRAGILTGSVTSAKTGAPLNAGFKLTRALAPNKWISTSVPPNYRVLIPPSTDTLLEVSASGYETWHYGGPSDPSRRSPLRLSPGAEMHLDILLEPRYDPNLHPSKFLVPDGYAGWLQLEYNVKDAAPVPVENGEKIFKFAKSGVLSTSSPGPDAGAENEYLYYSENGTTHEIPLDYRSGNAMIWGQHPGSKGGVMCLFEFFVGTEEQYKKHMTH